MRAAEPNPLLLAAITLVLLHFGVPLAYYLYLKVKHFRRPWSIRDES